LKPHRFALLISVFVYGNAYGNSNPPGGFILPDSLPEVSIRFSTSENLIILPVTINDSVRVNLILDTGSRNLVLFGKRFEKLFSLQPGRRVEFSGLGNGKTCVGKAFYNNKATISGVEGDRVPVIVVPHGKVFNFFDGIDGVIGYELFLKLEIEINFSSHTISFRSAPNSSVIPDHSRIPIELIDSRPVVRSKILTDRDVACETDVVIDTGSSLGLLIKTTDIKSFRYRTSEVPVGYGLAGFVYGYHARIKTLQLKEMFLLDIPAGITSDATDNSASLGMRVLKNYILVINYSKSFISMKRV
jgi:hypothetical protein